MFPCKENVFSIKRSPYMKRDTFSRTGKRKPHDCIPLKMAEKHGGMSIHLTSSFIAKLIFQFIYSFI